MLSTSTQKHTLLLSYYSFLPNSDTCSRISSQRMTRNYIGNLLDDPLNSTRYISHDRRNLDSNFPMVRRRPHMLPITTADVLNLTSTQETLQFSLAFLSNLRTNSIASTERGLPISYFNDQHNPTTIHYNNSRVQNRKQSAFQKETQTSGSRAPPIISTIRKRNSRQSTRNPQPTNRSEICNQRIRGASDSIRTRKRRQSEIQLQDSANNETLHSIANLTRHVILLREQIKEQGNDFKKTMVDIHN